MPPTSPRTGRRAQGSRAGTGAIPSREVGEGFPSIDLPVDEGGNLPTSLPLAERRQRLARLFATLPAEGAVALRTGSGRTPVES